LHNKRKGKSIIRSTKEGQENVSLPVYGGEWREPISGKYFENVTPVTGGKLCDIPRSDEKDINAAIDAAHAAKDGWGKMSATERSNILMKVAQRMEDNLELLARAETWDNGKPIRETMAADMPLAIDHFRYFAACIRAQEGSIGEIDHDTVAYHFHEPLGVVGLIVSRNELTARTVALLWLAGVIIAIGSLLPLYVRWQTSEFAVTDRRVLVKVGLLSVHTLELLLPKVEAIGVDQTIGGRLLGYGTLRIVGTGGTVEAFARVAQPQALREAVVSQAPSSTAARTR